MNNKVDKKQDSSEQEKTAIQKTLQGVSDDVLIGVLSDRIRNTPNEADKRTIQTLIELESKQTFSGPIPHPTLLAEYKSVDSDIPNRIVTMAEGQQEHRHGLENKSLTAAIDTEKRGQNYALTISLLFIVVSMFLIGIDKEISGSILAGSTMLGLAYMFVSGRQKATRESD